MELTANTGNLNAFLLAENSDRTSVTVIETGDDTGIAAGSEFRELLESATSSNSLPSDAKDQDPRNQLVQDQATLSKPANSVSDTALGEQEILTVTESAASEIKAAIQDGEALQNDVALDSQSKLPLQAGSDNAAELTATVPAHTLLVNDSRIAASSQTTESGNLPHTVSQLSATTAATGNTAQVAQTASPLGQPLAAQLTGDARTTSGESSEITAVVPDATVKVSAREPGISSSAVDARSQAQIPSGETAQVLPLNANLRGGLTPPPETQPVSLDVAAQRPASGIPAVESRPGVTVPQGMATTPITAPQPVAAALAEEAASNAVQLTASTSVSQGISATSTGHLEAVSRLKTLQSSRAQLSDVAEVDNNTDALSEEGLLASKQINIRQPEDRSALPQASLMAAQLTSAKVADAQLQQQPVLANAVSASADMGAGIAPAAASGELLSSQVFSTTMAAGLARSPQANAIHTPQSIVDITDPSMPLKFGNEIRTMVDGDLQSAVIRIKPADLGPVHVSVTMDNDRLTVNLSAAQAATRELLEAALPRLREQLSPQQFSQIELNVSTQDRGQGQAAFARTPWSADQGSADQGSADQRGSDVEDRGLMATGPEADEPAFIASRQNSSGRIDAYV